MKTIKTCKTGCGKMKSGGNISPKKIKTSLQKAQSGTELLNARPFKNLATKVGVGIPVVGTLATGAKALRDKIKLAREKKKETKLEIQENNKSASFKNQLNKKLITKKRGGMLNKTTKK